MELDKYITFLTFLPWIFIIIISMIYNLNKEYYQKFSFKYFHKNIFKIFRLDTLLLITFFWYFSSFDREFVDKYLFAIMCLYMFVNFFYEKKEKLQKNFWKENIIQLSLIFLIILIPFFYYYQTNNLNITYKIMLLYLFFEYIIILIVSYISKFLKKVFKRKDS